MKLLWIHSVDLTKTTILNKNLVAPVDITMSIMTTVPGAKLVGITRHNRRPGYVAFNINDLRDMIAHTSDNPDVLQQWLVHLVACLDFGGGDLNAQLP